MILVLAFSQQLSYVTILQGLLPETHTKVVLKMAHGWSNVMLLILTPTHSNNGNPILTTKLLVHFYSVLQSMSSFTTEKKKHYSTNTSNTKAECNYHKYTFFFLRVS